MGEPHLRELLLIVTDSLIGGIFCRFDCAAYWSSMDGFSKEA